MSLVSRNILDLGEHPARDADCIPAILTEKDFLKTFLFSRDDYSIGFRVLDRASEYVRFRFHGTRRLKSIKADKWKNLEYFFEKALCIRLFSLCM